MGEIAPPQTGEEIKEEAFEREVSADEVGLRLDRWFRRHFPDLPHSALERLLRLGEVKINQRRAKANARLESGAKVRVPSFIRHPERLPVKRKIALSAKEQAALQARVLYRDEFILVLNKPAGLAVQGGSRLTRHLDAMLDALQFDADEPPLLTHRLDKDTSGALILARNPNAAAFITAAFRERKIEKTYLALVCGKPNPSKGKISSPAGKKFLPAETLYQTLKRSGGFAWVRFRPITGRTHQIRLHASSAGFPIAGDRVYGTRKPLPEGFTRSLHLHSSEVKFPSPAGKDLHIIAPLPEHITRSLTAASLGGEELHEHGQT